MRKRTNATIHSRIQRLLERGERVFSRALGRFGEIMSVDSDGIYPVLLKPVRAGKNGKTRYATTFAHGDPVVLKKDKDGIWRVGHSDRFLDRVFNLIERKMGPTTKVTFAVQSLTGPDEACASRS